MSLFHAVTPATQSTEGHSVPVTPALESAERPFSIHTLLLNLLNTPCSCLDMGAGGVNGSVYAYSLFSAQPLKHAQNHTPAALSDGVRKG